MMHWVMRASVVALLVTTTAAVESRERWEAVPAADLSELRPEDFADDELNLTYHLAHFHRLANGVIEEGPDRGFIGVSVWRREGDNEPYNARVMENILSLVWFYTADRPWNPYRGSAVVRQRVEAAMQFWCDMQHEDGRFSEYGAERWNLPATAFATKFMGEALILLSENPDCPIDEEVHQRVIDANRDAIMAVLTREDFNQHGSGFSNQYTNVWAGAAAHLVLFPEDEVVRRLLLARMEESKEDFQSLAGFHYEAHGPDFGYGLGTHTSNHRMGWWLMRGTPAAEHIVDSERRWVEWLSYNLVPEPDGSGFVVNRGIETRTRRAFVAHHENPMYEMEELALGRAWMRTGEEMAELRRREREALEREWPEVRELAVGQFSAFSPYTFLHRTHGDYLPTAEQKQAAMEMLPVVGRERFNHVRADDRGGLVCVFVRRPGYYAAFNAAPEAQRAQQRFGLGLVWGPGMGSVVQSQTDSDESAWGTQAAGAERVYEAGSVVASSQVDGDDVAAEPGARDLAEGDVLARYALGEVGRKTVSFGDDRIVVEVEHRGEFVEVLPLLKREDDELEVGEGSIELRRDGEVFVVRFDAAGAAEVEETDARVGPRKRVVAVRIAAAGELRYTMQLLPLATH